MNIREVQTTMNVGYSLNFLGRLAAAKNLYIMDIDQAVAVCQLSLIERYIRVTMYK